VGDERFDSFTPHHLKLKGLNKKCIAKPICRQSCFQVQRRFKLAFTLRRWLSVLALIIYSSSQAVIIIFKYKSFLTTVISIFLLAVAITFYIIVTVVIPQEVEKTKKKFPRQFGYGGRIRIST